MYSDRDKWLREGRGALWDWEITPEQFEAHPAALAGRALLIRIADNSDYQVRQRGKHQGFEWQDRELGSPACACVCVCV